MRNASVSSMQPFVAKHTTVNLLVVVTMGYERTTYLQHPVDTFLHTDDRFVAEQPPGFLDIVPTRGTAEGDTESGESGLLANEPTPPFGSASQSHRNTPRQHNPALLCSAFAVDLIQS